MNMDQFRLYLKSGFTYIRMVTNETLRVISVLKKAAAESGFSFATWDVANGFVRYGESGKAVVTECPDPEEAIRGTLSFKSTVLVFSNFHFYIRSPMIIEWLVQNMNRLNDLDNHVVFLLGKGDEIPELKHYMLNIEFPLPDERELSEVLSYIIRSVKSAKAGKLEIPGRVYEEAVQAARGLSSYEAENVFALGIVESRVATKDPPMDAWDRFVRIVLREKEATIKSSQVLEVHSYPDIDFDAVGGMDNLKSFLSERKAAFGEEARKYGLPLPKGILMVGVPGTGKSLTAKAAAREFRIPLVRLDMGRLFGSLVGESERKTREMIRTVEAIGNSVIWIDEVEKGFAGAGPAATVTDSGVTQRVMSTIFTWLQEKRSGFVMATANDVTKLPPEMLRKGRFDELFFVDLPTEREREAIVRILLRKYRRDPEKFDVPRIAGALPNFTGSEIEQVIVNALYRAFSQKVEVTTEHILHAKDSVRTLYELDRARIDSLREWGRSRCVPAGSQQDAVESKPRLRKFGE